MRFALLTALCVAPLALAGTLQADLYARGAVGPEDGLILRSESKDQSSSSNNNNKGSQKANNNGNNGNNGNNNGGNNVVIQQSSTTEVIIIWYNQGGNADTTTVTTTQTVTESANGVAAAAATHTVVVGGSAGLVYTPDSITANIGDMVIFDFQSQNHTATQSAFTTPCKKLDGGMDTGFMANVNNSITPSPQMAMQVTVDTPIWFYCRQTGHCGKGMTFSINPNANKTQAMFQSMAIAQNGTGSTAPIQGGAATASAATTLSTASATSAAGTAASTGTSGSGGTGMVAGTGTTQEGGACSCSCLCGTAAFPNAAIQGVAAFGGMSGAMPFSSLEA